MSFRFSSANTSANLCNNSVRIRAMSVSAVAGLDSIRWIVGQPLGNRPSAQSDVRDYRASDRSG